MKLKMKWVGMLAGVLITLLVGGVAMAAGTTDWEKGSVQADGYGAAPAGVTGAGSSRIMARRAAIVDAYRNLAEYVQGVQVDATTTVRDMAVASDVVRTQVSAMVRGAQVVAEDMGPDGSYHVRLAVPLYGVSGSLASAVLPENLKPEAFPEPQAVAPAPTVPSADTTGSSAAPVPSGVLLPAVGTYTGLIVDCRGMELRPAMSPVIKDAAGTPIYGYKNLVSSQVIASGMAAYARELDGAVRAGTNPLVVKAQSLADHNANPVLSAEDASKVLVENRASGFLDHCAVVFLR